MKKVVKSFSQFINEAKFYHSLPNRSNSGRTRLRDEYRNLPSAEQDDIQLIASQIEELDPASIGAIADKLSRFDNIQQVKDFMIKRLEYLEQLDDSEEEESDRFEQDFNRNLFNLRKNENYGLFENEKGDEVDLKIYQSELNLLNRLKPTAEKHLKRKKFLEKEIARLSKN